MRGGKRSVTDRPSDDVILATQQLGAKSYQAGVSRRDNPYHLATDEALCMAWIRGYNMARTWRAREIALAG